MPVQSPLQLVVPEYVASPCPSVWNMSELGDVSLWTDNGETAAFSVQLGLICERILQRNNALPPLTAILFFLGATSRTQSISIPKRLWLLYRSAKKSFKSEQTGPYSITTWLEQLSQLPESLLHGEDAKADLLCDCLAGARSWIQEATGQDALDAVTWLKLVPADRSPIVFERYPSATRCQQAIEALRFMSQRPIDAEELKTRRVTGLISVPEKPEIDVPAAVSIDQTLRELKKDPELNGLAHMSIVAASSLALPRRPSDPDALPAGGVSDIVNKGNPHQLLSTELAADPMLLLARIATGQALYLRRESPPAEVPQCRPVLIELGIRTWGITRVRAAAMALAVASLEEKRGGTKPEFFSVAGNRSWPENLDTRDGIIEHLSRLEPDVHPGPAIQKLALDWESSDQPLAEPLLIVSSNTDLDPEFRTAILKVPLPFLMAKIDREGFMTLVRRTQLGDEFLQRMQLILPKQQPALGIQSPARLPIFLELHETPLRMPCDTENAWCAPGHRNVLWGVTSNRRIVSWDDPKKGVVEHASAMPAGSIVAHCVLADELCFVVRHTDTYLVRVHRNAAIKTFRISQSDDRAIEYGFDRGTLFEHGEVLRQIDISSGLEVARSVRRGKYIGPGIEMDSDRVLWIAGRGANAVAWHPWSRVNVSSVVTRDTGLAVRDQNGTPVLIRDDLSAMTVLDGEGNLPKKTSAKIVSKDPMRLIMQNNSDCRKVVIEVSNIISSSIPLHNKNVAWFVLSLDTGNIELKHRVHKYAARTIDPGNSAMHSKVSVRCHFNSVGFRAGAIVLSKSDDKRVVLAAESNPNRLTLNVDSKPCDGTTVLFGESIFPTIHSFGARWNLRHAKVKAGDIWLDSRGLLHLRKQSDGSELSLILHDRHVAGWATFASAFGPKSLLHTDKDEPLPRRVELWLVEFAALCM